MINGWSVVLQKTSAMFLVMVAGWLVARRGLWPAETSRVVSRFLVDIVYPCYVIARFLHTIDPAELRASWYVPLLGFAVIALGTLTGLLGAPFARQGVRRRTVAFIVSQANWIYLPLPIAEGLLGDAGVRSILLMNIGCTAAIWTIGIGVLNPGMTPRESLRHIFANPGILATAAGLALALAVPALGGGGGGLPLARPVLAAIDLLGLLMIPLSLLVTGARLGEQPAASLRPDRALAGVLALRLAIAPLVALLFTLLLAGAGLTIPQAPRLAFLLVAAMPPALSCTLFTERFNGDSLLASRAVFFGTAASLATVPFFFHLLERLGY